ncbi:MAG: N-6 DNA methylase [Ignavibacteriales bacterium]|nr:N-6 DNA methylase [Ignavibacteriales bacterium]
MAIFQKSVVNKYLDNLDQDELSKAFGKFKQFYGDSERIENIKLLKEENYQEGFLREIFVQVLGYTINPDKNYNLTTEYKNETDSKKADGAILKDSNAIGVIELKSTKTVNLESIINQAFNYKNHQPKCKYVITSNFEKLNFYIDNATEWEEFNLFTLTEKEFALFYLLLNEKNLLNDIPERIKKESRLHEENISDKLYKDYSQFKNKIYNNLVKNNPQYDKLVLFKKSQKFLDRILFVLFSEDSGLIPPNAISKIVDQWESFKELDEPKTLYSRFIKLFNHLDEGHTYKEYSLPAYNGGLFKTDEVLNNVHIDDEVLLDDILHLSSYDFSTEVDVNILGHIFEHSLTEIEELTAELEGTLVEREKTKRKKDGIFYTPKYITKYIVDNTIGALCDEKKKELNLYEIDEEVLENSKTTKGNLTSKAKKLFNNLDEYRKYILSLKILDPACGSGAFLNQALEFLINEHKWIDEHKASLLNEAFTISEFEKEIVENNIYGVDINEEAVEIAKLSLWLRTARKGRKLSTLSDNIKCGNSLIDDPEIAGEKAFNWNEEFKEIMNNGGFDVVIGNPPYVPGKSLEVDFKEKVRSVYRLTTGKFDLYLLFIEKILGITKENGKWGVIVPNTILVNENATLIRKELIEKSILSRIRLFQDVVFPDASVESVVLISEKKSQNIELNNYDGNKYSEIQFNSIKEDQFFRLQVTLMEKDIDVINKIDGQSLKLDLIADICIGIQIGGAGKSKDFKDKYISNVKKNEKFKKIIDGKDFENYYINWSGKYIEYGNWLHRKRDEKYFLKPKILIRQIGKHPFLTLDKNNYYVLNTIYSLILSDNSHMQIEVLFSILNSKLIKFYWEKRFSDTKTIFPKIKKSQLVELPIVKNIDENEQNILESNVAYLFSKTSLIKELTDKFLNRIKSAFNLFTISKNLSNFYNFDFSAIVNELKKNKISISLKQQDEWEEYFNEYKTEINQLQEEITITDDQIDLMVYKLYNLTYQEVEIIDPNFRDIISKTDYDKFQIQ